MPYLPYPIKAAIIEVCGKSFYYKSLVFDVLARAGVPENVFKPHEGEAKFVIARNVLNDLERMGDEGMLIQRRLLTELCSFKSLPDAAASPDQGLDALRKLKELAAEHDLLVREDQREAAVRRERVEAAASASRDVRLKDLYGAFTEMVQVEDHQTRGYDLEKLLADLFPLFDLKYRPSYRAPNEQVDGQFHFRGFDYIVEARWRQERATLADLLAFKGKVDRKIESTRGMFLSMSGFVDNAPEQLRQAGPANLILMDGSDLTLILDGRIALTDALEIKADKASQEGRLMYPVADAISAGTAAAAINKEK